jgi:hypothetical protein
MAKALSVPSDFEVSRAVKGIVDQPEELVTRFSAGPIIVDNWFGSYRMKPRTGTRVKYGPNIVRAWFDTVFHHLLQGLENERAFLTRGNWTFRWSSMDLEYLCPVAMLVPAAARENLDQLVTFFPEIGNAIEGHNAHEGRLAEDCRSLYEAILASTVFRGIFDSVRLDSEHSTGRDFKEHFGAYSLDSDFRGLLAEYLVNNVEKLPSYYSTAGLWHHYHNRFSAVLETPEVTPQRDALTASGRSMGEAVERLDSTLRRIRARLSLNFDVPYVAELSSVR